MFNQGSLLAHCQIIQAGDITDVTAGAFTGDRIHMKNARRVAILCDWDVGTDDEDATITVLQHDAASSGNSKDLLITRVYKNVRADISASDAWTQDNQPGTANTYVVLGELEGMTLIDIKADEMDGANGYVWLSFNVADVGTTGAKLLAGHYIKHDLMHAGDPPLGTSIA